MIGEIKLKLYQLIDTSKYIQELSKKLCNDYDYYSNLLILACVEEKYLMRQLEVDLDNYLNVNRSKWSFFKKTRITIKDDGTYYFKLPKLNEYSREYVELECIFKEVQYSNLLPIILMKHNHWKNTVFCLGCEHNFDSDKYLQMKNVRITYNFI